MIWTSFIDFLNLPLSPTSKQCPVYLHRLKLLEMLKNNEFSFAYNVIHFDTKLILLRPMVKIVVAKTPISASLQTSLLTTKWVYLKMMPVNFFRITYSSFSWRNVSYLGSTSHNLTAINHYGDVRRFITWCTVYSFCQNYCSKISGFIKKRNGT